MNIKHSLFALFLFLSFSIYSQDGSPSPYSYFGLGDTSFKGNNEILSMGGISSYTDSIHYNIKTPASLSRLKYVTLTLGISNRFINMEDQNEQVNVSAHNISYFAVGIPIGKKVGFGFGILPETSSSYKIYNEDETGIYTFEGNGGLSRLFIAGSYQLNKNISVGLEFQHHFGYLRKENIWIPTDATTYTREDNNEDLTSSTLKISGLFTYPLKKKKYISANLDYQFGGNLDAHYTGTLRLIRVNPTGREIIVSQVDKPEKNGVFNLPAIMDAGLGIGQKNKWYAGAGLTYIALNGFKNEFLDPSYISYDDSYAFHIGGMYKPEYNSITHYWKKITFRAGGYYKQTGMNIYGEDIKDFGITFGLGLPGIKKVSNLNLGVELGTRGTTTNNLVKENYFNLHISFSLNDVWFVKRKIN
jgi:hypothetical protein